jgi:O-antigen/teichoic acid export membrane protein
VVERVLRSQACGLGRLRHRAGTFSLRAMLPHRLSNQFFFQVIVIDGRWWNIKRAVRSRNSEMPRKQFFPDAVIKSLPAIRLYLASTSMLTIGIAAQSIGFVVLARWLGSDQFGHLSMITAATNLGGAWCGLGTGEAMRRRAGREPALYPQLLGHSLILLLVSGAVLTLVMSVAIASFITIAANPVESYAVIALLVSSNIVLFAWIGLTEQILLAHSQFTRANLLNSGFGIARAVTALVACLGFDIDNLAAWALWNFASFSVGSLTCACLLFRYGAPHWRLLWDEIPLGVTLSISGSIAALRQNVDLLALSAMAPPHLVGAYGVARRVLGVAVVTGASLDRQIYAKLAIAGKSGPAATLCLARRYVIYAIGLTSLTSTTIFVLAPLLPLLFGKDFGDMVWIVRVLCWTLILTAVQFVAFDAINAADQHRVRLIVGTVIGLAGAALIVGLSLAFGTTGTFVAVYAAEIATAAALWTTLKLLSDRQQRRQSISSVGAAE